MAKRLEGKVAVVTGAGRGIGAAHAMALAMHGAKVVVNDPGVNRDGTGSSNVADDTVAAIKKAGGVAVANYDSVSTPEGGEAIIKCAVEKLGGIHILVNNAGFLRDKTCWTMTPEDFDAVVKVHLYGHFNTIRAAAPIMRQQRWGRIINTSSEAGAIGNFGQANYSAAKEGIIGLTRTVGRELGKYGVTCNAIRPQAATRMTMNEDTLKNIANMMGLKDLKEAEKLILAQIGGPELISPFIVFLCTDEAANVNARVFNVGGGRFGLYNEPEVIASVEKPGQVWDVEELIREMVAKVTGKLVNVAPPQPK
ncbi:MAG: SDR family NAD(P)-dependent oxidoreductase [Dehalococcoidia bacterium]|nr:SDR family NAD(P)-dependent oxidoreductase [Dehalococcoidia bacterium]